MQKNSSLQGSKMKQNYPKQTNPLMVTYCLDSSQSRFHRLQRQTHQSYIRNKHDYSSKHWVWFLMLGETIYRTKIQHHILCHSELCMHLANRDTHPALIGPVQSDSALFLVPSGALLECFRMTFLSSLGQCTSEISVCTCVLFSFLISHSLCVFHMK